MSSGRAFTLVAVILGVIAVVLGVICSVIIVRTQDFLSDSSTASGRVIGLVPKESCDQDNRNCTTAYRGLALFFAAFCSVWVVLAVRFRDA